MLRVPWKTWDSLRHVYGMAGFERPRDWRHDSARIVPSGGGQWAVQGAIAVEAARELGVPVARAVLAIAYGDECSNMLQPFWALPLLALTGLSARDIFGYTALLMFLVAPVFILLLALM